MTAATVIKFPNPKRPQSPSERGKVRPYLKLDIERDLEVLYGLPNALIKTALYLLSRRGLRQPGAHWGEVAAKVRRSQPQVTEALTRLATLGFAESRGGLWFWKSSGNPQETQRKSYMEKPENAVQDSVEGASELKEYKELKENNNNMFSSGYMGDPPGAGTDVLLSRTGTATPVCEHDLECAYCERQAPVGAASDEAGQENLIQLLDSSFSEGVNVKDTGIEEVPAAGGAAGGYREHLAAVRGAGFGDLWVQWIRLCKLPQVSQEVQVRQWAQWVADGLGFHLNRHVEDIVGGASFEHPYAALRKRMAKELPYIPVRGEEAHGETAAPEVADLDAVYAAVPDGSSWRAPSGRVLTVDFVADPLNGVALAVFRGEFADLDARVVMTWERVS